MRRYALRDDQWDRIKDILPGRAGHVGVTAKDNLQAMLASPPRITGCSSRRYFTVIAQAYLGATCRNVLAIQSRFIRDFRAGRRAAHGRRSSKCWRPMRTTNTR